MNKNFGMLLGLLALSLCNAQAAEAPATDHAYQCNGSEADFSEKNSNAIQSALTEALNDAFGKDWARKGTAKDIQHIDPNKMSNIAKVSGCAAVVDRTSCTMFFDPEFSTTLGIFTMLPTTNPLRRQFDAAIHALPAGKQKDAALYCMRIAEK
ncbi:hypothetical protein [Dyella silvatica]|uniref:hypothetical protein n=1 Tax=Dyella silvatica TaxID=2992128 RepID=UPI0022570CEA|nr:hypothetical protein [Dyella silvatica]